MQQPMINPRDISGPTTAMNMTLILIAKAFKLNYSTPTNNNQIISSNPRNRQIAQPSMNMGQDKQMQMVGGNGRNQFRQFVGQNVRNQNGYNASQNVGNQVVLNAVQNPTIQNVGNQNGFIVVPGIANQNVNQNRNGNVVAARADGNGNGNNRNQIRCYNCRGMGHLEEAGIQLQAEEFDLMAAAGDLDEIEEVNANCILMENFYAKTITTLNEEIENLNNQLSKESQLFPFLMKKRKKLKSDFKIREEELLDKQIQLENKIKELDNILVKMGQSIQTLHMLSPKPNSFYHTEQKMALGYQNYFYLKQAQQKQQSLYNGKVLLEEHDPHAVHDSEETL
ncbi:hypothetical protein Tco_0841614 [Tanacetum coccineum]|uniref:CCHC-type domain-containing protein n=1 Tax=Tanacetum coccineum TaxID=301880 RepID=A0ABQ5B0C7_9ASTR